MGLKRECINCIYYPCLRITCGEVCNQYTTEVQELMKEIDKLLEDYIEFEGMR